jgi:hypothetical protein
MLFRSDITRHQAIIWTILAVVALLLLALSMADHRLLEQQAETSNKAEAEAEPQPLKPVIVKSVSIPDPAATPNEPRPVQPDRIARSPSGARPDVAQATEPSSEVRQAGLVTEGMEAPALALDLTPEVFEWLVRNRYATLLARSEAGAWKVVPDRELGFTRARFSAYMPQDALALSTRTVPIGSGNSWVSVPALAKLAPAGDGELTYELRLSSRFDTYLIQRQEAALAKRGIRRGTPEYPRASTEILVRLTAGKPAVKLRVVDISMTK